MNIYFQETFQRAFGTFPLTGEEAAQAIQAAADIGYRAFDTAQMYANEAETGAALQATGNPRDELCITTKVDISNFDKALFIPSVERSLKDLRVDQVDVLLLHWPTPGGDIEPSLRLLQQAYDRKLAKTICISNYTAQMMRDAADEVAVIKDVIKTMLMNAQVRTGTLQDRLARPAYADEDADG